MTGDKCSDELRKGDKEWWRSTMYVVCSQLSPLRKALSKAEGQFSEDFMRFASIKS